MDRSRSRLALIRCRRLWRWLMCWLSGFEHSECGGLGLDDSFPLGRDLLGRRKLNAGQSELLLQFGDPVACGRAVDMVVNGVGRGRAVRGDSGTDEVIDADGPSFVRLDCTGKFPGVDTTQ